MSGFFSWQHAIRASKLESTTKLVCYTIWSHMASDGTGCFPSYALIAEESGLSRRSVIEHVQKAAQAGFLVVDSRQRENGSASSNLYRPTMPLGSESAALGGERGSLGGGEPAAPPEDTTPSNSTMNLPPVSPKPTKASTRANARIRLDQFLENAGTGPVDESINWARVTFGWDAERTAFEWADFHDYWTSGNAAGGGLKADWPATWRTHCRRVSGIKERGPRPAGVGTGQSGFKRHDIMASATDTVLADLYGVQRKGLGGQAAAVDSGPAPWGSGSEAIDAMFVDAGTSASTGADPAGGQSGSSEDRDARTALPIAVE